MKILIVKTSSLGDIVQCFPVLDFIQSRIPDAEIDWVAETSCAELVEAHPAVHQVIHIHTRKWRKEIFSLKTIKEIRGVCKILRKKKYDVVIDLQGNAKSGCITFLTRGLQKIGFGIRSVPEKINLLATNIRYETPQSGNIRKGYLSIPEQYFKDFPIINESKIFPLLHISEEEQKTITSYLSAPGITGSPCFLVCPGANWKNKQLPFQNLSEFLKKIEAHEKKCSWLFIWGSEKEKRICLSLQKIFPENSLVPDRISLPALQNLMGNVSKVIAMDSLPLHLAATTNTPTFGIFGPSSAIKYSPPGNNHVTIQGNCPYNRKFEKRCPILRSCSSGACIQELCSDQLFNAYLAANS